MWGSIIGAAIGAGSSIWGAKSQNRAARGISERQMDFQREMSNTSYQRSMADMRKAGLNPMLAYQKGGASTPGGSQAPVVNPAGDSPSSARDIAMQIAQIKNLKEQNKNISMDTRVKTKEEGLKHVYGNQALVDLEIKRENLSSAKAASAAARTEEIFWKSKIGKILKNIDLSGRAINPFASSAKEIQTIHTRTKD